MRDMPTKLFECLTLPRLAAKSARLILAICLTAFLLLGLSGCIGRISQANRTLPFDPKSLTILPARQGLRVLVIGDFGTGGKGQRDVAKAIATLHKSKPFSFGIHSCLQVWLLSCSFHMLF